MPIDFATAIVDWRTTNSSGAFALDYAQSGYAEKESQFETVDELRLVHGANLDLLAGEDVNRNGVLDGNETDANGNGTADPGLFEYVTVYSRQPNYHSDGSSLTNVNLAPVAQLQSLFQSAGVGNASGLATSIYNFTHPRNGPPNTFRNILSFNLFCRSQGMSSDDFARIYHDVTISTNLYLTGLLNINTASVPVMTALFMGLNIDQDTATAAAQSLVAYRQQNPGNLNSVAWIVDALGNNNAVVQDLAVAPRDFITTQSFQFMADVAAVGPFGRGYRRVKFIFDISEGAPKIIYRQDLSRLGWALGEKARTTLAAKETP
jgi:hypothetical protein